MVLTNVIAFAVLKILQNIVSSCYSWSKQNYKYTCSARGKNITKFLFFSGPGSKYGSGFQTMPYFMFNGIFDDIY